MRTWEDVMKDYPKFGSKDKRYRAIVRWNYHTVSIWRNNKYEMYK